MAYYNEWDKPTAQWLRNLIAAGELPGGHVDDRSITQVQPADLAGYRRVSLFAGIGGWELALRLAGWPEDREVWTVSCPCQPFSIAGKGQGEKDPRHLWPHAFRLIKECRPPRIFGEQVSAAIGLGWLDRVFDDLESEGYACGQVVLPACSVGAPHIRQRIFWCAYLDGGGGGVSRLANARRPDDERRGESGEAPGTAQAPESEARERQRSGDASGRGGTVGEGLEHTEGDGREARGSGHRAFQNKSGWPTPGACDGERRAAKTMSKRRPSGAYRQVTLNDAANLAGEPCRERESPAAGWPTPTAVDRVRDEDTMAKCQAFRKKSANQNSVPLYLGEVAAKARGTTLTSSTAPMELPAELDAAFSLWLQGYSVAWSLSSPNWNDWVLVQQMLSDCGGKPERFWRELAKTVSSDCAVLETQSCPTLQRSSSKRPRKPRKI